VSRIATPIHGAPAPLERAAFGRNRSVHRVTVARRAIVVGATAALLTPVAALACTLGGARAAWIAIPFLTAALAIATLPSIAAVGSEVELFELGLALRRRRRETWIRFDDVDEVWFEFTHVSSSDAKFAIIGKLRLHERSGARHRVPMQVDGALDLLRAVLVACSHPLFAEARDALRDGETLTFGRLCLDRHGIATRRRSARWSDLRLVRISAADIAFFRGQTIVPWLTVRFDEVPHPTVFAKLVATVAQRVEYAPFAREMFPA
jgi:hypothetical protein